MTAICKNKINPSSKSEMILKELDSSHFSSFSVNLKDIFKVTAKYIGKLSPNTSKIVSYRLVGAHNHVHNILRLFDV